MTNLLYRSSYCLVSDDEKYFTYSNMQGNENYYTTEKSKCPDSVRFTGREINPNEVMDWVAIFNSGIL